MMTINNNYITTCKIQQELRQDKILGNCNIIITRADGIDKLQKNEIDFITKRELLKNKFNKQLKNIIDENKKKNTH